MRAENISPMCGRPAPFRRYPLIVRHGHTGETDDFRGGWPDTRHEDRDEPGRGEESAHPRDWVEGDPAHLPRRPP